MLHDVTLLEVSKYKEVLSFHTKLYVDGIFCTLYILCYMMGHAYKLRLVFRIYSNV